MTSTAVRCTSKLVVPSTQNTAPVLDFRCLYTHDLRRKAKRWQDGVLRFHTFNKRVMVYDISRNFIGDAHWRETGLLQDGDELELDKGVLIQVGEATGSMDQDLTSLFENRRKHRGGSSPSNKSVQADLVSSATAMPVPLSQSRPKTLNALLGTPKGPLGRAAIPSKSPCELRKQDYDDMDIHKPRKRQRVETFPERLEIRALPDEAEEILCIRQEAVEKPYVSSRKQDKLAQTNKTAVKRNAGIALAPIDLTEESHVQRKISTTSNNQKPTRPLGTENIETNTLPASPMPNPERRRHLQQDSAPINQLQVVARMPRKKLMYRDLLPPAAPASLSKTSHSIMAVETEDISDKNPKHHELDKIYPTPHHPNRPIRPTKASPPEPEAHPSPPQNPPPPLPNPQSSETPALPPIRPPSNPTHKHPSILPQSLAPLPPPTKTFSTSRLLNRSLSTNMTEPPIKTTKRSPLQKSISDTTALTNKAAATSSKPALTTDSKPDPWSREAWDLFGCGRPEGRGEG